MQEILSKRYSGRSYDTLRPVSKSQLQSIVEAARAAPSCYNEQPWYFVVCDRSTEPEGYNKIFNTLVEFNQGWAKNAPVLLFSVADSKFARNDKPNRWGAYDTGSAAVCMMIEATALGLMAHQMGGFDEQALKKEFSIPDHLTPMAVMAIGYATAEEKQPERERKPLSQNFYAGSWGNPWNKD